MVDVPKRNKAKVCIVCRNTVSNDRRTLTEASILAKAGLEAVVIGLLGRGQLPFEIKDGFLIRRVPSKLGLAIIFRDHLYPPVYRRLPVRGQKLTKATYTVIARWLRWVDRRLKKMTIYVRLLRAMLSEKADYYHAHYPFSLMVLTLIASTLLRRRFIRDYNDILVLEDANRVQNSYYEMRELWGKPLNARETKRINETLRSITSGVSSILDVGCGDGRITNRLVGSYPQVVGIDISKEALRYVQAEAIHGSVEQLRFEDRSFDLVLTTELLEHLPERVYQRALQEIQRVAADGSWWVFRGGSSSLLPKHGASGAGPSSMLTTTYEALTNISFAPCSRQILNWSG